MLLGRPCPRKPRYFRRPRFPVALALLTCLASVLAGCGYTHQELFPTDVRTIAIPIFQNNSPYRGMELDLKEALVKEIELRTPYKVVNRDQADTILEGKITSASQPPLSRRQEGGLPQEVEIHIAVEFTWKNLRTGKTLRDRKGLAASGRFLPAHPVGEDYTVGQHDAVERLVNDMISIMGSDW